MPLSRPQYDTGRGYLRPVVPQNREVLILKSRRGSDRKNGDWNAVWIHHDSLAHVGTL